MGVDRAQIHRRIVLLKRGIVVGVAMAFAAVWGVVAGHIVGVSAHSNGAPSTVQPSTQSQNSGGFFGNGDNSAAGSGSSGVGPGSGNGPVVGSGGS